MLLFTSGEFINREGILSSVIQ